VALFSPVLDFLSPSVTTGISLNSKKNRREGDPFLPFLQNPFPPPPFFFPPHGGKGKTTSVVLWLGVVQFAIPSPPLSPPSLFKVFLFFFSLL